MKLVELLRTLAVNQSEESESPKDSAKPIQVQTSEELFSEGQEVSDRLEPESPATEYSISCPSEPCYACGQKNYWLKEQGGWMCNICHPNPAGGRDHVKNKYGGNHVYERTDNRRSETSPLAG